MRKIVPIFALVIMLISMSIAVPQETHAAGRFFTNFQIPRGLQVKVDPVLKQDKLQVYFSSLFLVKKISYELTYKHDGSEAEGAIGEFEPGRKVVIVKEIFLGTCSENGTCVPHTNIHDMRLKVTATYNLFGKQETKSYLVIR